MRVRVRLFNYPDDSPTGSAWIGEVEDYQVTHVEGPIPEPTTITLLGIGLASIIGYSKKKLIRYFTEGEGRFGYKMFFM